MESSYKKYLEKLRESIKSLLLSKGYSLYSLTYSETHKEGNLMVVVDRDEPISLDDIVLISEEISTYLDQSDPIEVPYNLDVSSLGAEKPIDVSDLVKYEGKYLNLHVTKPIKGENILEGTIEKVDEKELILSFFVKGKKSKVVVPLNTIDKARLAIKF